jgi:mannose-1-phosphate guanylyltransferase / mannose-6-phosphate isomerase
MITPVLLSGGVGSRLWPVSREGRPKQFLPLGGVHTMLQETLHRLQGIEMTVPIVVCNEQHRFLVAEQIRDRGVGPATIILEPEGRNTAPAIALAAIEARSVSPDAMLLVLPADHAIVDPEPFRLAVEAALPSARSGRLMTFGVVPKRAEAEYGYIRCGVELEENLFKLEQFVEKPDVEAAERYLREGGYLWNSGMFLFGAEAYLEELERAAPEIHKACVKAMADRQVDLDFLRPEKSAFLACPSDSIDFAVMEHTQRGAVVALNCGWSDICAWSALWEIADRDESGNACEGDVLSMNCENSYFRSEKRLVAATGVKNLVVVETADAVLVADRNAEQGIKQIVATLKERGRSEATLHQRVYRPWGSYESLIVAERFQVKRIIVNPGHTLSLQKHFHRAEHWIVVSGTAEVTCDDKVFILGEDESTYIPLGHQHRLSNPGKIALELIEVQTGAYLGEDDIVRYEDVYGRHE